MAIISLIVWIMIKPRPILLYEPTTDTLWIMGDLHHIDWSKKIYHLNTDGTFVNN